MTLAAAIVYGVALALVGSWGWSVAARLQAGPIRRALRSGRLGDVVERMRKRPLFIGSAERHLMLAEASAGLGDWDAATEHARSETRYRDLRGKRSLWRQTFELERLIEAGDLRAASNAYDALVPKLERRNAAMADYYMGRLLILDGEWRAGRERLEMAKRVREAPIMDAICAYYSGLCSEQLGEPERARTEMQYALDLGPELYTARLAREGLSRISPGSSEESP